MFHLRDGFTFERQDNGDVILRVLLPVLELGVNGYKPSGDAVLRQTTVPAAEWASAVANVRAGGETADSHAAALKFHQGAPL